ncbi:putative Ig domain-containing protein [Sandaracinus amylolyticus]|uniref:Internalin n=1 Tax=Sandaracinus amylolyticus TaxID=927083 RepID=A0A0F6W625_9BACT|nr:putative Ig domain-containing protein [Sandaracinus amylolyticus]AKF08208.1 internalin [Sandaracinus amylolyticus]
MKHVRVWSAAALVTGSLAASPSGASAAPPVIAFTSPTAIEEGREVTLEVTVTDPEGAPVTWSWDTDGPDGVFGDHPNAASFTVPAAETDGPGNLRIGVRATDGTETTTVYRTITVANVAPEITSFPLTTGSVRHEYRYELRTSDPAGANDPITYALTARPPGMEVVDGVVTWTPTIDQRGRAFDVTVRAADGDGATDTQSWTIEIARNTAPSVPSLSSPIERARIAGDEPTTLTVQNATDPDGDPLVYFFRLSRESQFDPARVIGSGEVAEQEGETTSWTTSEPLDPGLWYWQAWVSDGIVETSPRFGSFIVGDTEYELNALPDAGTPDAGSDWTSLLDAGPSNDAPRGGCAVDAGATRGSSAAWLAGVLALGLVAFRRARRSAASALVMAALTALAVGCTDGEQMTGGDGGAVVGDDSDFDTISDADEGADEGVDTDEDSNPDFRDPDSDGDTIPDSAEAGDEDRATPPVDSDADGTPDYRDLDADDNGIPDGFETRGDTDLDGIADHADLDDDGDLVRDVLELMGVALPPADTDGDVLANYHDPDCDDDHILDGDEWNADTDQDGLLDFEDHDTDNDGIPDAVEAGDADIFSAPRDSDDDGTADFRDTDSDNDGLSDSLERESGSDPTRDDSDGDGVSDLIEVGAGTDPNDGSVSPRTRGDFVFVVPFEEAPAPARDTLRFRTTLQLVDVYFLFDISGSMSGELEALAGAVSTISTDLTCTSFGRACRADGDCDGGQACSVEGVCIEDPAFSSCVASAWTGAGIYEQELENLLSVQDDPARTAAALNVGTFGGTEQLFRAAWGVADPAGAPGVESGCAVPALGRLGCPAFRENAQRILVIFTDEISSGSETAAQAGAALRYANITTIGVWSGTPGAAARDSLVQLARASNSFSSTGQPLVFEGMDGAVVPRVISAINEVVEGVPLRVTITSADEPGDAGDALQFIDHVEVNVANPDCTAIRPTEDTDANGHDDAFPSLLPGTPVCWDVVVRQNDTVEPATVPLVFRARLTVHGDGSPLDSRIVYFLVPPVIPGPEVPI